MIITFFQLAFASPSFTATHAQDAALASAAWDAATLCTGRQGHAHAEVHLARESLVGGYLGLAHTDDEGLYRIEFAEDVRLPEVVAHEVAHAWVYKGHRTLVEGATELLADCIARKRPDLFPMPLDDGRSLPGLTDLRQWTADEQDRPLPLQFVRTDAYLGAARLMRLSAEVVPETTWWSSSDLSWNTFEAHLESGEGENAQKILHMMRNGTAAQQHGLSDQDQDGVVFLQEVFNNTDPNRFDSNGDGWWDGAVRVPEGATALPVDSSPVCQAATTAPNYGGNLRGAVINPIRVSKTSNSKVNLVSLIEGTHHTGALWVNLSQTAHCNNGEKASVYAGDPQFASLTARFLQQVERSIALAEERVGPQPGRIAVALGGTKTTIEGPVVWFSTEEVINAINNNELDHLAHLAVSLRHSWRIGRYEWQTAEGIARSLALNH